DLVVARAAAQIACDRLLDLVGIRPRSLGVEGGAAHDEARRTVATLDRAFVDKGLLHGVQLVSLGKTLDRDDLAPVRLRGGCQAAHDGHAVQEARAGAALALGTTLLGP